MSELSNILQSMIDNEGYDGPITSEVSELLVELAGAVGGAPTDITAEATFDSKVTNYGTKIYKKGNEITCNFSFYTTEAISADTDITVFTLPDKYKPIDNGNPTVNVIIRKGSGNYYGFVKADGNNLEFVSTSGITGGSNIYIKGTIKWFITV